MARFKSYEQGRVKFQGETLDWLWFDEEPEEILVGRPDPHVGDRRRYQLADVHAAQGRSDAVARFSTSRRRTAASSP